MDNGRVTSTWWMLKIALGLVPCITGLDKFFNVLTNWTDYLNPAIASYVPLSPEQIVQCAGILELLVGLAILTRWTKLGAYVAALWLAVIAANLITMGRLYDVAIANLVLAVVSFALAWLTDAWREEWVASDAVEAKPLQAGILRLDL